VHRDCPSHSSETGSRKCGRIAGLDEARALREVDGVRQMHSQWGGLIATGP
jgi:hypothetical protein